MNKIWLLVGGGVVVAGVVGVVAFSGGSLGTSEQQAENGSGDPVSMESTFKDIVLLGKSYQCTFSQNSETGLVEGEVFIAKENMVRGNYKMTDPSGDMHDINMMQDGEFTYIWGTSPMGSMGLKTKIEDIETTAGNTTEDVSNFLESEEEFDFDCKLWKVDNSFFVAPTDVEWNIFEIPTMDGEVPHKADICSSCDAVPEGQARTQCLASLSSFGCE